MKQHQLPILDNVNPLNNLINVFMGDLIALGFYGDIHNDYASRISSSMDNSIYIIVPELIILPKGKTDVNKVFRAIALKKACKYEIIYI